MNLISVVIVGFTVLEATNVVALYFSPGSKYANSVGVFGFFGVVLLWQGVSGLFPG